MHATELGVTGIAGTDVGIVTAHGIALARPATAGIAGATSIAVIAGQRVVAKGAFAADGVATVAGARVAIVALRRRAAGTAIVFAYIAHRAAIAVAAGVAVGDVGTAELGIATIVAA